MSKIQPLEDKILVEPIEEEKKSAVLRPETEEKKRPCKGRVFGVGPKYKGDLKKGDVVMYQKYGPEEFVVEGKKYHCGNPEDFYIVIK